MKCSVDGCEKNSTAKGLCPKHYMRARNEGSIQVRGGAKPCPVANCKRFCVSRDMCDLHAKRMWRTGKTELKEELPIDKSNWTATNIAWLAGLIEGEGCFSLIKSGRLKCRIKIVMTDLDVLEKCKEITKLGRLNGPYKHKNRLGKKEMWCWEVAKKRDVLEIIKVIYPYLLSRRKAKIDHILTELEKEKGNKNESTN